MESLLLYALKASALMALFFAAYHILLKKETFFTANRAYLIMGIITSALLPLAEYTKVIFVEAQPVKQLSQTDLALLMAVSQKMQQNATAATTDIFNWWHLLIGIYAAGVVFFSIKLGFDIYSIRKMLKGKKLIKQGKYKLVDSPEIETPFSFFSYIVFNSKNLKEDELESIISHEKVHSKEKHSADMLLSQLFCILFWFNPLAWMYKKAISQNLEFIADEGAIASVADRTAYQKTMLRLSVQPQQISIINHFYQSLIKKRIVMLNKQKSSRRNFWKYAALLPVLAGFIMAFQVKTVAKEKEAEPIAYATGSDNLHLVISKTVTTEVLNAHKEILKGIGVESKFSNIERNSKGEVTAIKIELKAKGFNKVYDVDGSEPISDININVITENGKIKQILVIPGKVVMGEYGDDTAEAEEIFADTIIVSDRKIPSPPAPPAPPAAFGYAIAEDTNINTDGTNVAMNISDNTLVIVNGKKLEKGSPVQVPAGQQISSVNVLKGKDSKNKYGKEAKDGAIEITTTKTQRGRGMNISPNSSFSYGFSGDDMPEMQNFSFNWNSDVMPGFEVFENFSDADLAAMSNGAFANMNTDQFKKMMKESMRSAQMSGAMSEDMRKRVEDQMQSFWDDNNVQQADMEKVKAEMKKAKEEMRKVREEMNKTREEMLKERKKAIEEARKKSQKA